MPADTPRRYPIPVAPNGILGSCCAAEVVALGTSVTKFKTGDRVAPTVNLALLTGEERDAVPVVLGGDAPGVLREYAVFDCSHLVALPAGPSWEEVCHVPALPHPPTPLVTKRTK